MRTIYDHSTVVPLIDQLKNEGIEFKIIWTKKKQPIIVDPADYDELMKHRWNYTKGHATYTKKLPDNKQKTIYMHRLLLGVDDPKIEVDHKNHIRADNRRVNIRITARFGNTWNNGLRNNNTSGYRGVSHEKDRNRYHAYVAKAGVRYCAGYFKTAKAAAIARDDLAIKLHGEFAFLNFPIDTLVQK